MLDLPHGSDEAVMDFRGGRLLFVKREEDKARGICILVTISKCEYSMRLQSPCTTKSLFLIPDPFAMDGSE